LTGAALARVRAPAKVNLCLFLGPPREDGRHELVTLFESVSLFDELTVAVADADSVVCAGVDGPNLVGEALAGLRALGWEAPPVRVEITKRIPVAGGMGGGSADAAALLRSASELSTIAAGEVAALAAELGADVPAQLRPGVAVGTGAGEVVRRVGQLVDHAFVIVPLPTPLSTAAVYAEADRQALPRDPHELGVRLAELESALGRRAPLPSSLLVNDLEPAARALCESIDDALDAVRGTGADYALVSGSGPTVVGVFWGHDAVARSAGTAEELRGRFPAASAVTPVSSQASGKMGRS
jgi:4-diphosphocytidyl-2-C-methyl-D-erythritol kinase